MQQAVAQLKEQIFLKVIISRASGSHHFILDKMKFKATFLVYVKFFRAWKQQKRIGYAN